MTVDSGSARVFAFLFEKKIDGTVLAWNKRNGKLMDRYRSETNGTVKQTEQLLPKNKNRP